MLTLGQSCIHEKKPQYPTIHKSVNNVEQSSTTEKTLKLSHVLFSLPNIIYVTFSTRPESIPRDPENIPRGNKYSF